MLLATTLIEVCSRYTRLVLVDTLTVIRHHHGKGSEEGLEVVRQLRPASVAGVHGDEGSTGSYQLDLTALEQEHLGLHGRHMGGKWDTVR